MSGTQEHQGSADPITYPDDPTPWMGFVILAGVLMVLTGVAQAIGGIVALVNDEYYKVPVERLALPISYTAWGWLHLIIGVLIVLAGVGVLLGQVWARAVGVVLAVVSALVNMAFVKEYPFLSTIVVVFDVLVIYALVAHGREAGSDTASVNAGRPRFPFIRQG